MKIEENSDKIEPLLKNIESTDFTDSFLSYISDPKNAIWNYKDKFDGNSILHILLKDQIELAEKVINIVKDITTLDVFTKFINHQNNKGINILHIACYKGNMNLIKLLLNNGINYKVKSNTGLSCLHFAAQTNKVTVIYYFIKKYKIYKYEEDNNGNNFYHWACYCSSEKVIDFFLNDKKFEINKKNKEGYLPIHFYLLANNSRSIKRLIYRGADVYMKNNKGENAFNIINNNNKISFDKKLEIKEILNRKYYLKVPYLLFLFFHFIYIYFIIIFEFPFIDMKRIILFYRIYLLWTGFVWIYIIYFLNKSPGKIKPNRKNYLLNLIENDKKNEIDLWSYCIKCKIKKEADSNHCYFCDECYSDFDHHCIWLKKCIAKNNKKNFYSLILIILLNATFNIIICFLSEINNSIKTEFIFTSFLLRHMKFTLIIKTIIFAIYFLFVTMVYIILIPLIKFYIRQINDKDIFELQNPITKINNSLNDINDNDNDETDKLIKKNTKENIIQINE